MRWTTEQIPRLDGRVYVITGANSGLGLETTRALAEKGATVVMGCRSAEKAGAAVAEVRRTAPEAILEVVPLDLASLGSVRAFAETVRARWPSVDGFVANAGVMALPRTLTADGFEMQLGTNHLGHFALTLQLLPAVTGRVVVVSSEVHRGGRIQFDDLMGERSYSAWAAYAQSKLANLLFVRELHKRSARWVAAAHPGYAATALQGNTGSWLQTGVMNLGNAVFAQSAAMGALPSLYALFATEAEPVGYYGPSFLGLRGYPVRGKVAAAATDDEAAARLWAESERLTGVAWS